MKFNIIKEYNEMQENGLYIVDILTNDQIPVCRVEHTDLMGGFDELKTKVDEVALYEVLKDLNLIIFENGEDIFSTIECEMIDGILSFTDDTDVFAIITGNKASVIDDDLFARAFMQISVILSADNDNIVDNSAEENTNLIEVETNNDEIQFKKLKECKEEVLSILKKYNCSIVGEEDYYKLLLIDKNGFNTDF